MITDEQTAQWRADESKARDAFIALVDNAFRNPGAKSFARIPADPERDADLIIGRIVDAFPLLLDECDALRAELAAALDREPWVSENRRLRAELERARAVVETALVVYSDQDEHNDTGLVLALEEWEAYDAAQDAPVQEATP